MNTTHLSGWRTPATNYPRRRLRRAAIKTHPYPPGVYHCYMQRGFEYFATDRPLAITTLDIAGKTVMVDDPPHWWAMEEHAAAYHGHVLCAGLGLGLMVHTLTANPKVTGITVIERERDVIELLSPHIPQAKLTIIEADYYEVSPRDLPRVDGVLFDLFVGDGRELMGEGIRTAMETLERWPRAGDDEFVVRVHGLPNPYLEEIARAITGQREDR